MSLKQTRKSFLKVLGLGTAGLTLKPTIYIPSHNKNQDKQHITIYKKEGEYAAFPNLYQLSNGSLYTEFKSRPIASQTKPYSKIIRMISRDGGRTWETTREKEYNPDYKSSGAKLVNANAYGWRNTDSVRRKELEMQGIEVQNSPGNNIRYAFGCYKRSSTYNGKLWETVEIGVPSQSTIMPYKNPSSYLRTDDDIILRTVYGKPKAGDYFFESWMLRSEDNGESWEFQTIGSDRNKEIGFGETALVQAPNGDIVAMMRSKPTQVWKYLYVARSFDQGKTWTKPKSTGIVGHPAHLVRLKNGHLLCTYGYRIRRNDPMELRAVFSYDNGKTWDLENIRILRNDTKGLDIGSPVSIQREDGKIFTNYYMTNERWGLTHIEGTIWGE